MRNIEITRKSQFLLGAGLIALMAATPAMAQDTGQDAPASSTDTNSTQSSDATDQGDEIVVIGQRANLESAQERKRNAGTVMDSITADEIGSFPDKSVAGALARVPGITVSRFSGSDDTSHFSAEPSGVIIRGLPQVRSEFNGRDTFSANSNRGLSWQDISPELLAGVDTYKNETADMIEGGIAGTVNLRTRLPFDSEGRVISLSADLNYGDRAKSVTPEFSAIVSNRWQTGIGEIGALVDFAYSHVKTGSQGIQYDRMGVFQDVFGPGKQYIPSGIFMRENVYDRVRYGAAAAVQWRSNDGKLELTGQYLRSQYNNSWREHAIWDSAFSVYGLASDYVSSDPSVVAPQTGSDPFAFDDHGNFMGGNWSSPTLYLGETPGSSAAIATNAAGEAFFNKCYSWEGCDTRLAPQLDTQANALRNKEYTQDASLNLKWDPTDRLHFRFDAQHVNSEVHNYNASVDMRTFADTYVDATGKYPTLTISPDSATNINLSPGGITNPNNYSYYSVSDHTEDSNGHEWAFRADVEYDVGATWLESVRAGIRYADRSQTVRWGAYNWANIANTWSNNASYYNVDSPTYPSGNYENYTFSKDFFNGNQMSQNSFVFFNMDKLENLDQLGAALGYPSTGVGEYYPVCSNQGYRDGETVSGKFGCYLPSEVLHVDEITKAAYVMANFGGPDLRIGGVGISGNIGARFVWTKDNTQGAYTFPNPFTAADLNCSHGTGPDGQETLTAGCVTSADEIAFSDGSYVSNTARAPHFNFLPSVNVKFDVTDKFVVRMAMSRAMSRPDIGLLRNYTTVNRISPILTDSSNPNIIRDENGEIVGYNWRYTGQAGNPFLKPITADQFDLSFEYYMAPARSLTFVVFQKNFHNYIQSGTYNQSVTNNGVTRTVLVTGPMNGSGAKIRGAEVNFQTFFDFLPEPLNGFGVQANFTYVDNNGIKVSALTNETGSGTSGGGLSYDETAVKPNALEGVSEYSYNLVGMYESGRVSVRLAYNWRSEYVVTAIDCCVGLPIWQKAAGFLDGSVRFQISKWLTLNIEGSNLLGTDTVLLQQVDNDGLLKPNAWFKNDRTIQAGIQMTF
ncbi:TonB-dependent receptor [Sphingosinithalassobacter portus]|uniref:TonB-dependent receptor n=1 Tax=Stakelama portus TaxID=2676234 RepID=UPI000D6DDA7D|nr:TonB-dependent receptor [Sphingosinithalassobacter portus]